LCTKQKLTIVALEKRLGKYQEQERVALPIQVESLNVSHHASDTDSSHNSNSVQSTPTFVQTFSVENMSDSSDSDMRTDPDIKERVDVVRRRVAQIRRSMDFKQFDEELQRPPTLQMDEPIISDTASQETHEIQPSPETLDAVLEELTERNQFLLEEIERYKSQKPKGDTKSTVEKPPSVTQKDAPKETTSKDSPPKLTKEAAGTPQINLTLLLVGAILLFLVIVGTLLAVRRGWLVLSSMVPTVFAGGSGVLLGYSI
jgi:uncharacterized small protein (DUF1192 family)